MPVARKQTFGRGASRMGRLTNRARSRMIPRSAEANRRSSPTRSRHRSGHGNHEPLRSFLFGGPWSRTSRDAASSAICARETRDKKEQNASENHDHVGRGPVRRNAPPSAPSRHLRPTLLQHKRLHQLSHRRLRHRSRALRDLRLHPPAQLTPGAAGPGRRLQARRALDLARIWPNIRPQTIRPTLIVKIGQVPAPIRLWQLPNSCVAPRRGPDRSPDPAL